MFLASSRVDRQEEREPGLERPCQRSDDHVGPVGVERVERSAQGTREFELGVNVLLVAAVVGLSDDLFLGQATVVGNVEEVAKICPDAELAALFLDELSQDDNAIAALGAVRLVLELGGIFGNEALVGENLVGFSVKLFEISGMNAVSALNERRVGVVAKDETHASLVPVVEMGTHGEVGVPPQQDVGEAGTAAELNRLVEDGWRPVVGWTVSAAVDDEERLASVGERDHEWVIAPDPLVRKVHALLALTRSADERAVGIDTRRLLGQRTAAHLPDPDARVVDYVHQTPNGSRVKTATEVAGCRWIGDRPSPQQVEEGRVIAS